ncbi:hypothetical protein SFC65_19495 [Priestia filamentosa]|uniref:hypothetical protein n=1 Tax=Priestia filamentosa TaxID=1402861 RepID=UPI0039826613
MKLFLKNATEKRYQEVEVSVGDKVQIAEWDGIEVRGTVCQVSDTHIRVDRALFLSGAYEQYASYDKFENQTVFSFDIGNLAEIKVAKIEETTPLTLIHQMTRKNYCGSDYIKVSPLFHEWYKSYVKDHKIFNRYCGLDIKVDPSLEGLSVYAVPNEETKQHNISPKLSYTITFFTNFKKRTSAGFAVFSSNKEDLARNLENELQKFSKATGIFSGYAYQLTNDNGLVERGTSKNRYPVAL